MQITKHKTAPILKPHGSVRRADRLGHPGAAGGPRGPGALPALEHGVRDPDQRRALVQDPPGREPELSEQTVQLPAPGSAAQSAADVVLLQNVRDAHIKT
uniref:(northern house mosquito) hypothetical protein n=1 Tax=Culex pipiens TaxID=7175 RepID=A0A8D8G6K4_CULPI